MVVPLMFNGFPPSEYDTPMVTVDSLAADAAAAHSSSSSAPTAVTVHKSGRGSEQPQRGATVSAAGLDGPDEEDGAGKKKTTSAFDVAIGVTVAAAVGAGAGAVPAPGAVLNSDSQCASADETDALRR